MQSEDKLPFTIPSKMISRQELRKAGLEHALEEPYLPVLGK